MRTQNQAIPPIGPRYGTNSTRQGPVFSRAKNCRKTGPGLVQTVKRQVDGPQFQPRYRYVGVESRVCETVSASKQRPASDLRC